MSPFTTYFINISRWFWFFLLLSKTNKIISSPILQVLNFSFLNYLKLLFININACSFWCREDVAFIQILDQTLGVTETTQLETSKLVSYQSWFFRSTKESNWALFEEKSSRFGKVVFIIAVMVSTQLFHSKVTYAEVSDELTMGYQYFLYCLGNMQYMPALKSQSVLNISLPQFDSRCCQQVQETSMFLCLQAAKQSYNSNLEEGKMRDQSFKAILSVEDMRAKMFGSEGEEERRSSWSWWQCA